jgi:hypothetical protein
LANRDAQGKPLVGNLFEIPPYHSWLKFKEWADTYGPVFRLNLMGRQHVVLSTEKIANDLLRERGSYYSSREFLPMASGIVSGEMRPLLLPYNGKAQQLVIELKESPLTSSLNCRSMASRPEADASVDYASGG